MKVAIQMPMKSGLRLSPLKTLRSPWILRALISLNRVIITNVLKMMVKCWDGAGVRRSDESLAVSILPLSMSNHLSPDNTDTHCHIVYFWALMIITNYYVLVWALSVTEHCLLQPLVCGTVCHRTSLLPSLSPSSAVVLNHISSHFLIPLSDSSLICTVPAQWLVILDNKSNLI